MHMKDDHMRNAQLKPGYNVQIAVDSEYIVAADIFQDRNDVWTLVPFLKDMETKLGFRYPNVTADSRAVTSGSAAQSSVIDDFATLPFKLKHLQYMLYLLIVLVVQLWNYLLLLPYLKNHLNPFLRYKEQLAFHECLTARPQFYQFDIFPQTL